MNRHNTKVTIIGNKFPNQYPSKWHAKTFKNVFCRTIRTAKNCSKKCFVVPCGQLKTLQKLFLQGHADSQKPFKNVFCRSMRIAKNRSKIFSAGPCGSSTKQIFTLRNRKYSSIKQFLLAKSQAQLFFACEIEITNYYAITD